MYDIFFISKDSTNANFANLKARFPLAKIVNSFEDANLRTFTKFFWVVWPDIIVEPDFNFDYQVSEWDKDYVHVFKNGEFYDGICLSAKNLKISKRELDYRFFVNKKEIDIIASTPAPYERFYITEYKEYVTALETCSTDMFWAIWPNIEILDNSIFNLYFSHHNTYDKQENHVWKNACNDTESYISGLTLFSKTKTVSKREINYKMLVNRKEHDTVASRFRYPQYHISTYDEYLAIYKTETAPLFWVIWSEIQVTDSSIFDLYYDPLDGTYNYDRQENHVFQNQDIEEIKYNGVMLLTTQKTALSKREIDFRYIVNKKEHAVMVSKLKSYDIIFISYNESNAEENWNLLKTRFPNAKRVHGIKGIHNAHIEAAKLATTPMLWVVDGDAIVEDSFDFSLLIPQWDRDIVHVWRSLNPVTKLEYGYGGVKLLPRILTLNMDINSVDMTTSISKKFKAMPTVSNITAFNTDAFSTWRSAFRECCKLSVINNAESLERLNVWCTLQEDVAYGDYAYLGALAGRIYGGKNASDKEALGKINDFTWLQARWQVEKSQLSLEHMQ